MVPEETDKQQPASEESTPATVTETPATEGNAEAVKADTAEADATDAPTTVSDNPEAQPSEEAATETAGVANDAPAAEAPATEAAPAEGEGKTVTDGDATSAEGDAASDAAEGAAAEGEPAGDAAAEGEGKKKKKRRRKKKKKGGDSSAHAPAPFNIGEEVFGRVTAVLETAIMVDLSGKALAVFDRSEMEDDDLIPAVDDRFVGKVLFDGGRGGHVVLTRKPLRDEEAKPRIEQAAKENTVVTGLVTGVIKGGVEVLLDGLRAFAPASGMDLHPRTANFANLIGQRLDFKVATYEGQGKEIVVTRRPMLEKEAHERRKKAREVLKEGLEMEGVVRTVVEWGAFVALPEAEYLEGLVHISELSHNPRDRVADLLKPGQKLKVQIQKIDEKGKIWLSRKALIEDPFEGLTKGLEIGAIIEGEVQRVEDFGAFIKLEGGFEGLCHVSDMGAVRVEDAKDVMQPGQKVEVVVHHIDPKQRRIALHPAPPEEQRNEPKQKVGKGKTIEAEIVKVGEKGLNLRILGATGRQARAFMPPGQTGTPRGSELRKHFNVGDKLKALVIDIDPKRREAKLSLSRLAQEEERRAHKEYQKKVKAESNFGTLGDLLKSKLGG